MDVDNVYLSKLIPGDQLFYYLSKVSVSPLKQGKQDKARADYQNQYKHLVMSASQSINTQTLQNFGLNKNQIVEIKSQIQTFTKTIKRENSRSRNQEQSAIEDASQKLNDIKKTITTLQAQIKQKRQRIKKSYREIGYHCNQIVENCIDEAIARINKDIKQLKQELITEKNKELKVNQSTVTPEGQPQKEIASKAISLVEQLQSSHAKVNKLLEQTIAVNHEIQSSESKQTLEINRQVDKYWVYLDPVDQVFKVMVVVKFKLKQQSGLASLTVNPTPRNAKVRILNINPRYTDGIRLKPGEYHIEVSKKGYQKSKQWVTLGEPDKTINVRLKPEKKSNIEMVEVSGGCFQMGSNKYDNEKPHKVCVDDFEIGQYEVTQKIWQAVMGNNPSKFKKGGNHPVEKVSWDDIQQFIKKLNQSSGHHYRLPTEAEWEYACRSGGKDEKYCGGNQLSRYGWHGENWQDGHHPVGGKSPNGLGLYDMSGNVWEWVQDWYGSDYYSNSPRNDPPGPSSGSGRVRRGGSWLSDARHCRSANRYNYSPDRRYNDIGFRLARTKN